MKALIRSNAKNTLRLEGQECWNSYKEKYKFLGVCQAQVRPEVVTSDQSN